MSQEAILELKNAIERLTNAVELINSKAEYRSVEIEINAVRDLLYDASISLGEIV